MKIGEEIAVSNGRDGKEYRCGIREYTEDAVLCELRFIKEDGVELPSRIYLFQGLPKADKMELIIQKAVELGVYQVIPVAMKRCVVKLDDKKAASKITRWQGIAEAGSQAEQTGNHSPDYEGHDLCTGCWNTAAPHRCVSCRMSLRREWTGHVRS